MSTYQDKKALVLGFGLSGIAASKFLCQQGARVTVTDKKSSTQLETAIASCAHLPIQYEFGDPSEAFYEAFELIVVSPGVSLKNPLFQTLQEKGIRFLSELELGLEVIQEPLIATTGTNGKSTTTCLISHMLEASGKSVFTGGNIGKPVLDYVLERKKADVLVLELSSFQLERLLSIHPQVAIFTNLDEDHLDRHESLEAYIEAKKRLLLGCESKAWVILNRDCPRTAAFSHECRSQLLWFHKGRLGSWDGASWDASQKKVMVQFQGGQEIYDLVGFRLFGEHNKENLMAAILTARTMGVAADVIQKVIRTFPGMPHRLEFIRKKEGVFFFNDSKGTNVMSMRKSLGSFPQSPIILIAGGKDKDSDFSSLVDLVKQRCKILILLGEAKEKMNRAIGDYSETYLVGTFEEAVLLAYQKSRSGDVVLLSPGCASYDMFRDYQERGDYFKKLVNQL